MSIRRMVYVACDSCGDPCGGTDQMADDAKEAVEWRGAAGLPEEGAE